MKRITATPRAGIGAVILAAAIVALAGLTAAAQATFKGKPGPITFQRFADPSNDRSDIFAVEPPGGGVQRLTAFPNLNWFPDYSPNGKRIVFTRTRFNGEPDTLYTMKADGSDRNQLATACTGECLGDSSAAWAPDGRRLVFERAFGPVVDDAAAKVELHIADSDGTEDQTIPLALDGQEPHDAQWAPNGRRLAVNILNVGDTKPKSASAIYVFRPDGTGFERITPTRLNAGNPDWAPNGKRIVFNSSYEGQAQAEIYTVRPNGTGLKRLRRQPEGRQAFEPVFSPDGKRIAFAQTGAESPPHIWTMRRNGTRLEKITHGNVVDVQPDWGARAR